MLMWMWTVVLMAMVMVSFLLNQGRCSTSRVRMDPSGRDSGPEKIPAGHRNRLRSPPRTRRRHPRDPERSSARTR